MEYQIEVKELLIEDDTLTLNIMGTVTDEAINSHFVSKPKLTLFFTNGKEDRNASRRVEVYLYASDAMVKAANEGTLQ